jgi:hypothetical protein
LTDSSQIQRWGLFMDQLRPSVAGGEFVKYDDHLAALEKEKAELAEISESLQAESDANFGDFEKERTRAEAAEKKLDEVEALLERFVASLSPADQKRIRADREEQEDAR